MMGTAEVLALSGGLYRVTWADGGGTSLAAVGCDAQGRRWLAPCNWIEGVGVTTLWERVGRVEPIVRDCDEKDRQYMEPEKVVVERAVLLELRNHFLDIRSPRVGWRNDPLAMLREALGHNAILGGVGAAVLNLVLGLPVGDGMTEVGS